MKQINNKPTKHSKITLDDIEYLKDLKMKEIQLYKDRMLKRTHLIFAPIEPATNKAEALMRTFNTGMAVFDGVMMGLKTIGKIKKFLDRKSVV